MLVTLIINASWHIMMLTRLTNLYPDCIHTCTHHMHYFVKYVSPFQIYPSMIFNRILK